MLLLGLGTSTLEYIDADIRTTATGLSIRYESDFDCELAEIVIRVDQPDERPLLFRQEVGGLVFGDNVEAEFADSIAADGRPFVPSDHENPQVGVNCIRPMGMSEEFVSIDDLAGSGN